MSLPLAPSRPNHSYPWSSMDCSLVLALHSSGLSLVTPNLVLPDTDRFRLANRFARHDS